MFCVTARVLTLSAVPLVIQAAYFSLQYEPRFNYAAEVYTRAYSIDFQNGSNSIFDSDIDRLFDDDPAGAILAEARANGNNYAAALANVTLSRSTVSLSGVANRPEGYGGVSAEGFSYMKQTVSFFTWKGGTTPIKVNFTANVSGGAQIEGFISPRGGQSTQGWSVYQTATSQTESGGLPTYTCGVISYCRVEIITALRGTAGGVGAGSARRDEFDAGNSLEFLFQIPADAFNVRTTSGLLPLQRFGSEDTFTPPSFDVPLDPLPDSSVPEPSTLAMLTAGFGVFIMTNTLRAKPR